jgi:hypothetical protein
MCVVSNMMDSARYQWPPISTWPVQTVTDFSEIIKKLSEIDKKLGAKDCYDPKKEAFLKELDDRLKAIEKHIETLKYNRYLK